MPLIIYQKDIEDRCRLAVWHMTESMADMEAMAELTEADRAELAKIKLEKRKMEWLSVRILLALFAPGKSLFFLPNGKPMLTHGAHISISHSGNMAGIALGDSPVGLDVQGLDERILRIESKFTNEIELQYLPSGAERLAYLTTIWCVKEAIFKYFGEHVEFAEDIVVRQFLPSQSTINANYQGVHGSAEFELTKLDLQGYHILMTQSPSFMAALQLT
jgi:phosphopantetheinyl transferase